MREGGRDTHTHTNTHKQTDRQTDRQTERAREGGSNLLDREESRTLRVVFHATGNLYVCLYDVHVCMYVHAMSLCSGPPGRR